MSDTKFICNVLNELKSTKKNHAYINQLIFQVSVSKTKKSKSVDAYFYSLHKTKSKGFKFSCNLTVDWDLLNKEIYHSCP